MSDPDDPPDPSGAEKPRRPPSGPPPEAELPVEVELERALALPPEAVFDAWIDPDLIARWMFGPPLRDEEVQGISVAPRAGGSFSFRVLRGGEVLDHAGRYLVLDRPRRLAFTWGVRQYLPESSRVHVELEPTDTGTHLRLVHRMPADAAPYADQTREGWGVMLDLLADVVAGDSGG